MNLKEERTEILWGLVAELSRCLAVRELTPVPERTGLYKDTTNAMSGIMSALLEEINSRKPDSVQGGI